MFIFCLDTKNEPKKAKRLLGGVFKLAFAIHRYPHFARIFAVFFDFSGNLVGDFFGFEIVELGGVDKYAHLSTGLNGKYFFDSLKTTGNRLKFFQAFDIFFKGFSARPRT